MFISFQQVDPKQKNPCKKKKQLKTVNSALVETAEVIKIRKDDNSDSASSEIDILDVSDAELENDQSDMKDSLTVTPVICDNVMTASGVKAEETEWKETGSGLHQEETVNVDDAEESKEEEHLSDENPMIVGQENEYPLINHKGEIIYFPNPMQETILDKDSVSESEKDFHYDFFDGSSKTRNPERYLKIRNYILESWLVSSCGNELCH